MERYQSKETVQTLLSSAAVIVWGAERAEVLRPVLAEVADQLFQVSQFPLAFEEEPAFFSYDAPWPSSKETTQSSSQKM